MRACLQAFVGYKDTHTCCACVQACTRAHVRVHEHVCDYARACMHARVHACSACMREWWVSGWVSA